MKRFLVFFVLLIGIASADTSNKGGQIAYVNTLELLSYAPQRQAMETKLRLDSQKMQNSLNEKKAELKLLKQNLEKETILEEKQKLEKQILDKKTLIARKSEAVKEAFLLKRNDEIAKFQRMMYEVIAEVAKNKHYDIVFSQSSVVYVSKKVDITEEVMRVLSARLEAEKKDNLRAESEEGSSD